MQTASTRIRLLLARYYKNIARLRRSLNQRAHSMRYLLTRLQRYERQLQRSGIATVALSSILMSPI